MDKAHNSVYSRVRPQSHGLRANTHRASSCSIVLVATVVLVALFCLAGCASEPADEGPVPYFDWSGFIKIDGRYIYTGTPGGEDAREGEDAATGSVADKTGVDVSENQGQIDWKAVRTDGIRFAFVRIGYRGTTEGGLYLDDRFAENMTGARKAGVECGGYFFSQATSVAEAREEAAFVIDALDSIEGARLDYPIVFDYEMKASGVESRVEGVSSELATQIAQEFCDAVEAAGFDAMVYGNSYDLGHYNLDKLQDIPLWYAEYGALPSYSERYEIWQYASEGSVEGIDTIVDLNLDLRDALPDAQSEPEG